MGKSKFEAHRLNAFSFDPDDLVLVEEEGRALYDPRVKMPLDEALVLSIMSDGVIEPIVVAKLDEQPIVIDGRQRVRAAREANSRLKAARKEPVFVPAHVRDGSPAELFGVTVAANEIRQDDSPVAKARKLARLLQIGYSEEMAANKFGVTLQTIKQWEKLNECAASVLRAVDQGKLSSHAASQLAGLPNEEQAEKLAKLLEESTARSGNGKSKRPSARKVAQAAGKAETKMRSRREIKKCLDTHKHLPKDAKAALLWVLGSEWEVD